MTILPRDQQKMYPKIHYFGSYLAEYARHRIIQSGLRSLGATINEVQDHRFILLRWSHMLNVLSKIPQGDLIIVGEASNYLTPILIEAKRRKLPVIYDVFVSLREHFEDALPDWKWQLIAPLAELIDWLNQRTAGVIVFDTNQHRKHFIDHFGVELDKTHVVYVGAETDLFYPRPHKSQNGRAATVLFYGTFHRIHGIDIIIRAAAEVQKHNHNIRFQIVGNGPLYNSMQALAEKLDVSNVLWGPKHVPYHQLPKLISHADICLGIFGKYEKTNLVIPNKLYQCAAMGIPVLTADTLAVSECFSREEVVVTPPGDAISLAQTILELANNEKQRRDIGIAGAKAIQMSFQPQHIALQMLGACSRII